MLTIIALTENTDIEKFIDYANNTDAKQYTIRSYFQNQYINEARNLINMSLTNNLFVVVRDEVFYTAIRAAIKEIGIVGIVGTLLKSFETGKDDQEFNIDKDGRMDYWPNGIFDNYGKYLSLIL